MGVFLGKEGRTAPVCPMCHFRIETEHWSSKVVGHFSSWRCFILWFRTVFFVVFSEYNFHPITLWGIFFFSFYFGSFTKLIAISFVYCSVPYFSTEPFLTICMYVWTSLTWGPLSPVQPRTHHPPWGSQNPWVLHWSEWTGLLDLNHTKVILAKTIKLKGHGSRD